MMKIIGGLAAFLLVLMAAGWLEGHLPIGVLLAVVAGAWCAFLGWMHREYRASLAREKEEKDSRRV